MAAKKKQAEVLPTPKRRGRPPKAAAVTAEPPKRRGRPPGSKNKVAVSATEEMDTTTGEITKKKPTPRAGASKGTASMRERLRMLVESSNAHFGAEVVKFAEDANTSYKLRRPTGITSLDVEGLAGGFPCGSFNIIVGSDGVGKDYLINCTLAEAQRHYGDDFRACIYSTEFKYDKEFARMAGLRVADTPEEIEELRAIRASNGLELTDEEIAYRTEQVGDIVLIEGLIADQALDIVASYLAEGIFQIIVINSLGVLQTAAKEEKESLADHAQQANEASLLTRFMTKAFLLLNGTTPDGRRNETTILATNQMRAKRDLRPIPGRPVSEKEKWEPGVKVGALKHGKAIELRLDKSTSIIEASSKMQTGREVEWGISKGKLGTHDGIKGRFNYMFNGGVDKIADLVNVAVRLGVIESSGTWRSFMGERLGQGNDAVADFLRSDTSAYETVKDATLKAAKIDCRYV